MNKQILATLITEKVKTAVLIITCLLYAWERLVMQNLSPAGLRCHLETG